MIRGAFNLAGLYPPFASAVRALLEELDRQGVEPIVTSGYRSNEEQLRLYRQGRSAPGPIVTKALPGGSAHNFGLAADITSTFGYQSIQQRRVQELARSMGFGVISWDPPHVEHPRWPEIQRHLRAPRAPRTKV